MASDSKQHQGDRTHDQFERVIHRQSGLHKRPEGDPPKHPDKSVRQSEFPVSEHGMNQESEHNKHNHPPKGAPKH